MAMNGDDGDDGDDDDDDDVMVMAKKDNNPNIIDNSRVAGGVSLSQDTGFYTLF